ncbi:hydroxyacylglutathione hydrolase [Polycyclovorans algicola]|uniref:hydroxyacylglutathione hydrolase n=1 Tax=Polycyclovorans algicola TaxID=616992 RepID=UPI0004A6BEB4
MSSAHPIPIFQDNYVWCWPAPDSHTAWVVDPGDAAPVLAHLKAHGWTLGGILVTHWHPDHIGGIPDLLAAMPCPVIGPAAEAARIPTLSQKVGGGEVLDLPIGRAQVFDVPGHTLGHIAFLIDDWLFCGDTLFCGGCGRLFEGTPEQMLASLNRLAELPPTTHVACTHEYTLSNLRFAAAVEPDNADLQAFRVDAEALRAQGKPTLPSTLARERALNPFLRANQPTVRAAASARAGKALPSEAQVFAEIRAWKDHF